MQLSRTEIQQERDELIGVEPCSLTRFSEFEGTIYGMSNLTPFNMQKILLMFAFV